MGMKTAEELAEEMLAVEYNLGESLMDDNFGSLINARTLMTWCYGKGYLTREQFNLFVQADADGELEAEDMNYILFDADNEVPFAIVSYNEDKPEDKDRDYKKAFVILAEFVLAVDVYLERWNKWSEENKYEED